MVDNHFFPGSRWPLPTGDGSIAMISTRLRDRTQQLLRERPRTTTLEMIADATGLSARWIQDFGNDRSPDPGVCKVETLYTYLTGGPLLLEPEELR